ncbi:hypothetical protein FA15DRAFT_758350 [Coprinopsis marcescibilis]|uniref:Uncharacterized protein n=1 Tax=Coprinopsis marcescibilis TaxID=230819 RepID=A0A5C3KNP8_COPMA|nr:hypothetical protein FA15DRAFT_758350 [Coprinopsis marcescibilis]
MDPRISRSESDAHMMAAEDLLLLRASESLHQQRDDLCKDRQSLGSIHDPNTRSGNLPNSHHSTRYDHDSHPPTWQPSASGSKQYFQLVAAPQGRVAWSVKDTYLNGSDEQDITASESGNTDLQQGPVSFENPHLSSGRGLRTAVSVRPVSPSTIMALSEPCLMAWCMNLDLTPEQGTESAAPKAQSIITNPWGY